MILSILLSLDSNKLEPFQSWDYNKTWRSLIMIMIVCVVMLIANVLRRKIPFLRKLLLPTSVIAGFIGLLIKYLLINVQIKGMPIIDNNFYQTILYHSIAIGFIALGLKTTQSESNNKNKANHSATKSGLLIVSTYLIQGIVGVGLTILLALIFKDVAPFAGILLPMGFGQGPGQAYGVGLTLEKLGGFKGGEAFGLSIASFGFVWACIPGVIYLNYLSKKGQVRKASEEVAQHVLLSEVETKDEIPLTEAVDKFTIQICFVGIIYLLTFGFVAGLSSIIDASKVNFLINNIKPLVWNFNFIFAILFTLLFKKFIGLLRKMKLMKRKYTNDYLLNRISGFAFDIMITTSIISIQVENLKSFGLILALIALSSIGGIVTFFYVKFACKRLYREYEHEAMAGMFGMLTGTVSTGIALLREIDPNFETPAADDLVLGSSTAVIFGGPILIIVGLIYLPEWYWIWGSLLGMIIFFLVIFAVLFLKRRKKLNNK